jgi:oxygen-independent coproporphyrinogen-3 oxidase
MTGLYIHVPFCRSKCPYCDFFSLPAAAGELAAYPGLLRRQLAAARRSGLWTGPFSTVFFGGGTPSLLPAAAVGELLAAAGDLFGLAPGAEITLEANPGTLSAQSLAGFRAAGVNRLSLGLQSLDARNLQRLGRGHSAAQGEEAVRLARGAGFDNVGLDLIYGLPGQTEAALAEEIGRFLALAPDHLSCYGLTVEEGTPFHRLQRSGALQLPEEETAADLFRLLDDRLPAAGLRHYEIANYALPGRECRHNLGYWARSPYLGLGGGAHSFLDRGWGERRAAAPDLERYRRLVEEGAEATELLERFDRRGAMAETLYLGLRTAGGVEEAAFCARFGTGVAEAFPEGVRRAGERLALRDGRWRFDLDGWLLYDHLITPFL